MKKAIIVLIIGILFSFAFAEEEKQAVKTSPALERVKIGEGATVLVPKGAQTSEKKGVLKVEDPREYSGRKFDALEEHVLRLEEKIAGLDKQLAGLKAAIEALGKDGKEKNPG